MPEKEPTPENTDAIIDAKLKELYEIYADLELTPELEKEWYWVEQEANCGKKRMVAREKLEAFIQKLEHLKKEKEE